MELDYFPLPQQALHTAITSRSGQPQWTAIPDSFLTHLNAQPVPSGVPVKRKVQEYFGDYAPPILKRCPYYLFWGLYYRIYLPHITTTLGYLPEEGSVALLALRPDTRHLEQEVEEFLDPKRTLLQQERERLSSEIEASYLAVPVLHRLQAPQLGNLSRSSRLHAEVHSSLLQLPEGNLVRGLMRRLHAEDAMAPVLVLATDVDAQTVTVSRWYRREAEQIPRSDLEWIMYLPDPGLWQHHPLSDSQFAVVSGNIDGTDQHHLQLSRNLLDQHVPTDILEDKAVSYTDGNQARLAFPSRLFMGLFRPYISKTLIQRCPAIGRKRSTSGLAESPREAKRGPAAVNSSSSSTVTSPSSPIDSLVLDSDLVAELIKPFGQALYICRTVPAWDSNLSQALRTWLISLSHGRLQHFAHLYSGLPRHLQLLLLDGQGHYCTSSLPMAHKLLMVQLNQVLHTSEPEAYNPRDLATLIVLHLHFGLDVRCG